MFSSSELIGGNAKQYWLTERDLEGDPTWAEHMPTFCPHFKYEEAESKEGGGSVQSLMAGRLKGQERWSKGS